MTAMTQHRRQLQCKSLGWWSTILLLCTLLCGEVSAWSTNPKAFQTPQGKNSPLTRGMISGKKAVQKPSLTEQNMLRNSGFPRERDAPRKGSSKLSNSVLASCDTLPSFPTAHGLLSPETVMRIEDLTNRGHGSDALVNFLNQYRKHGPLSCLSMLSDPEVLPHLTQAMRDIAD